MKLAKRISIALLAACVVGGSAVAMTACGSSAPEQEPINSTPTVSEDSISSDDETMNNIDRNKMLLKNLNMVSGQMVRVIDSEITDRFGNTYDNGVQYDASENSYGTYNLDGKYSTFTATAYVSTEAVEGKEMWISVYADDELVYHKEEITENTQPFTITADISGGDLLKIETGNNGSYSCGYLMLSNGYLDEGSADSDIVDYSGAYLRTFDALPFQSALKDAVNMTYSPNERVTEMEVLWYDDWDSLKDHSTSERPAESDLAEDWVPVGCRIKLDWEEKNDSDPEKFDLYLSYNAKENTLDVVKLNVYFDTDHNFYSQDESLNAVMQLLAILDAE